MALIRPRTSWIVVVVMATVAACSGGDDAQPSPATGDTADTTADETADDTRDSEPAASSAPSSDELDAPDDESDDSVEMASEPLGFDTDVYEVPAPPSPADPVAVDGSDDTPVYGNVAEVIDAGIEAGVWTEPEAVRAMLSVLYGEFDPARIPALTQLTKPYLSDAIERGIALVDDPSVDEAERADLARLTAFWTVEDLFGPSPRGFRSPSTAACSRIDNEDSWFEAAVTTTVYCRYTDGVDELLIPASTTLDPAGLFSLIDRVRSGYVSLSGVEVPPMTILFSTAPDPNPDPDTAGTLGLVAGGSATNCRMAIFQPELLPDSSLELDFTIAHEMWHCVQETWDGSAADLTQEGGAEYFAYEVLGKQCEGTTSGAKLDADTVSGSLLDTAYEGWFFWAYLVEEQGVAPSQLAAMHNEIYGGAGVPEALQANVGDLSPVLNEFFVRMMGPGLACGFQGSQVTDTLTVDQAGQVDLAATLWEGRRYFLDYAEKKSFEQVDGGGGPIGMAEFAERSDAASWVINEPIIRTTCDDDERWIAVATAQGDSSENHVLDVRRADDGACDPCVVGDWLVDLDPLGEYFNSFSPEEIVLQGTYDMTFTPGPPEGSKEFSDARNWVMSFPSAGGALSLDIVGGGTGGYSTDGDTLTISGYAQNVTAQVNTPLGGQAASSASLDNGSFPYMCEGDEFSVQIETWPLFATRNPATPQGTPYF